MTNNLPKFILILLSVICSLTSSGQVAHTTLQAYATLNLQNKNKERVAKNVREIVLSITDKCQAGKKSGNFVYQYDQYGNVTKEVTLHYTKEYTNHYNGTDLIAAYSVNKSDSDKDRRDTATYLYEGAQLKSINEPTSTLFQHNITDFSYDESGRLTEERRYSQARYPTGNIKPLYKIQHFYIKDSTYTLSKSINGDTTTTHIHLEFRNKNGKLKVEKYGLIKNQKTIYSTVNTFAYDAKGNLSKIVSIGYHPETGAKMLGPHISLYKNKYDKLGNIESIEEFIGLGVPIHAWYFFDKKGRITTVMKDCETWVYTYK